MGCRYLMFWALGGHGFTIPHAGVYMPPALSRLFMCDIEIEARASVRLTLPSCSCALLKSTIIIIIGELAPACHKFLRSFHKVSHSSQRVSVGFHPNPMNHILFCGPMPSPLSFPFGFLEFLLGSHRYALDPRGFPLGFRSSP